MTREGADYKKVIELLRKSKPSFDQQDQVEEYILRRIERNGVPGSRFSELAEALFGWVYIPLVRRILVAASIVLVGIFIFQQYILVEQVRNISRQVVVLKDDKESAAVPDLRSMMMKYRISDQFRPGGRISISGRELEKLIDAYNELDGKYRDLLKVVEENPELRKYVEGKLEEKNKSKTNL